MCTSIFIGMCTYIYIYIYMYPLRERRDYVREQEAPRCRRREPRAPRDGQLWWSHGQERREAVSSASSTANTASTASIDSSSDSSSSSSSIEFISASVYLRNKLRTASLGTTSCQARATSNVGSSPRCLASESTSKTGQARSPSGHQVLIQPIICNECVNYVYMYIYIYIYMYTCLQDL